MSSIASDLNHMEPQMHAKTTPMCSTSVPAPTAISDGSGSVDHGHNGMFGEDEFQHILAMVPSEDRARMRRVSRMFNRTFTRIGYHLDPLFVRHTQLESCFPYYPFDIEIRANPMLVKIGGRFPPIMNHDTGIQNFVRLQFSASREELLQRRNEFITAPPISTIYLFDFCQPNTHTVLRTATPNSTLPQGIRIGDLLDTIERMAAQKPKADLRDFAGWWGYSNEVARNSGAASKQLSQRRQLEEAEHEELRIENEKKMAKGTSRSSSRLEVRARILGL